MDYEEDHYSSNSSPSASASASSSSSSSSSCSPPPLPPNPSPKRNSGRKKFRETRHPVYHGVRQRGKGGKWVSEVREPKKKSRIWLGTYPTPEMAARAHDVAAIALRGKKAALLNFPNSAWDQLPQPESSNANDIRRAAAKAAEMFHQPPPPPPAQLAQRSISPNPVLVGDEINSRAPQQQQQQQQQVFVDEEATFDMPGLLKDMAEGMMVTPPPAIQGFDWDGVEMECHIEDMTLWSF